MTKTSHPAHSSAFMEMVRQKKALAAAHPCRTFTTAASVALADWNNLSEASRWCQARWKYEHRPYRRKIDAANSGATFEFDIIDSDVVWFKFRYGAA